MESVADSPHEPDDQQDCLKLSFWTVGDSEVIQIDMRIDKDKCASSKGWHVQWETVPPGNSQDPVAWVAFAEETKRMKPTDKAILGMVSESPGRNASYKRGCQETFFPRPQGGRGYFRASSPPALCATVPVILIVVGLSRSSETGFPFPAVSCS